jgi:mannose-1-phosphate guanylyltransferase
MTQHNYVVVMAGGIGSRFWPMSRTNFPKQFHDVLNSGATLLQQTVRRFRHICPIENVYIVTNKDYIKLVKEQLPELADHQIMGEPIGRNTAPCVAWACTAIHAKDPKANVVVAPSDHVILNEAEFERIILQGLEITAKEDVLMTLGIQPNRPDTGYGYIQFLQGNSPAKKVKTFTEKPELELAKQFLKSGDFVWNSGIFLWRAEVVLKSIETHLLDMYELFDEGIPHYGKESEDKFIAQAYPQCRSISIDYGIMEKSDNVVVLLSNFGWSDLGTWKSLYDLSKKDDNGNVVRGNVMLYGTKNSIARVGDGKLLVVQGLNNYIVVESNDAIMICHKDEEQKVKEFVADVKEQKEKKFS